MTSDITLFLKLVKTQNRLYRENWFHLSYFLKSAEIAKTLQHKYNMLDGGMPWLLLSRQLDKGCVRFETPTVHEFDISIEELCNLCFDSELASFKDVIIHKHKLRIAERLAKIKQELETSIALEELSNL